MEIRPQSLPAVDLDALTAAIRERPLFTPGRRPLGPTMSAPTSVAEAGLSGITARLLGLMTQPGERQALFARDGEKPFTAKSGDEIDGWTVASIEPDSVVMTSALGERTLHPTLGARPPAGGASGQAPAAAATRPPPPQRLSAAGRTMQPPASAAAASVAPVAASSAPPVTRHPGTVPPNSSLGRQGAR